MDLVTLAKAKGAAVLGLGVSGIAAAEFLLFREVPSLFLCDKNPLKAHDPMAWVGRMNSIRQRVEEMVLEELIYG